MMITIMLMMMANLILRVLTTGSIVLMLKIVKRTREDSIITVWIQS